MGCLWMDFPKGILQGFLPTENAEKMSLKYGKAPKICWRSIIFLWSGQWARGRTHFQIFRHIYCKWRCNSYTTRHYGDASVSPKWIHFKCAIQSKHKDNDHLLELQVDWYAPFSDQSIQSIYRLEEVLLSWRFTLDSKRSITPVTSGASRVNPTIAGVVTHLPTGVGWIPMIQKSPKIAQPFYDHFIVTPQTDPANVGAGLMCIKVPLNFKIGYHVWLLKFMLGALLLVRNKTGKTPQRKETSKTADIWFTGFNLFQIILVMYYILHIYILIHIIIIYYHIMYLVYYPKPIIPRGSFSRPQPPRREAWCFAAPAPSTGALPGDSHGRFAKKKDLFMGKS